MSHGWGQGQGPGQWQPQQQPPHRPKPAVDRKAIVALGLMFGGALLCGVFSAIGKRQEDRQAAAAVQNYAPQVVPASGPARPPSMCAAFSAGNSNSTPEDRASWGQTYRAGVRWFATHRTAWVEAAGPDNKTIRVGGVAACDDATLRQVFDTAAEPSNFRTLCSAFGFETVECNTTTGVKRTIRFDDACRCRDRWNCQCDY
jgi:hypothetical protein